MQGETWHYMLDDRETGPVTAQVIRSLFRSGRLTADTRVRSSTGGAWVPLGSTEFAVAPPAPVRSAPPAGYVSPPPSGTAAPPPGYGPAAGFATGAGGGMPATGAGAAGAATTGFAPHGQTSRGVHTFSEAVTACLSKYGSIDGRANRKEYWYFVLFGMIVYALSMLLDFAFFFGMFGDSLYGPVLLVTSLALLVPGLTVTIRRLHDTERSGWWLLIPMVPLIGYVVLIVFLCLRGTDGPNRFGSMS